MSKTNPVCRVCGATLNDENWFPSFQKKPDYICKHCEVERVRAWKKANPDKVREGSRARSMRHRRKQGVLSYDKNRTCSQFLGIHVAERVLSHVFKNVERMPNNNTGYDFICNLGKKIDVKSACLQKNRERWTFHIDRNPTADFFLCIAFDNREDLNPLYVWLIPGNMVNNLGVAGISQGTLSKWDEYKLDISKVLACCNTLRNQSATATESPSLKSPAGTHSG